MKSIAIINQADLNLAQVADSDLQYSYSDVFGASAQYYFGSDRGMFLSTALTVGASQDFGADLTADMSVVVGGGYGRVLDARPIAQAAAMCKVVEKSCDAAQLQKVADVIAAQLTYTIQHKLDANVVFYKELSEALGGVDSAGIFKVQQVLNSPIYNIGSRRVGLQAGAGLAVGMGDLLNEPGNSMGIYESVGYATLLDATSGITVVQSLQMGMTNEAVVANTGNLDWHPGDGNMLMNLTATYNKDHSSSWQTIASASVDMNMPDGGDAATSMEVDVTTNYAMGWKTVFGAGFNLSNNMSVDDSLEWSLNGQITHFIF